MQYSLPPTGPASAQNGQLVIGLLTGPTRGREQVRRIRIAPIVVNAHRGPVGQRVYVIPRVRQDGRKD